ncbi:unnamed protein product [Staurois parvus]|uniref:Secreted protein n=1 Tax=Staurois parvus TaxID=386267 RepID=A0ABN9EQK4_9NEOB|nr:unnamed protein product [Staurois parvus]
MISALMIGASSAIHQFHPLVPSSAAHLCPAVPPTCAQHTTQKCCQSVPSSCASQCRLSVLTISTYHQCQLISATYQCHLSVPISAAY